ncbi:MAG: hypothetical protein HYR64_04975 [Fimbriimonas ginsengisoli]|uniref:Uncharacterized protein n=1 Tax=Fimbriimonas ginsengisoli TaxID=1005039 RepID=A0A931LUJ6_FIMGI|nr:hypothetical protein [Fimbriimonas ginsengisoli]
MPATDGEPLVCPGCGKPLREERSHYRCESCGIVEACCEAQSEGPEAAAEAATLSLRTAQP